MDTLDNELNVQAETRQMQTLQLYQKLVLFTLLKFYCCFCTDYCCRSDLPVYPVQILPS